MISWCFVVILYYNKINVYFNQNVIQSGVTLFYYVQ